MRHDGLRHAAKQQTRQAGMSVRAQDDEIGSPFGRLVNDHRAWIALPNGRINRQACPRQLLRGVSHDLSGALLLLLQNVLRHECSCDELGRRWKIRLDNRENARGGRRRP